MTKFIQKLWVLTGFVGIVLLVMEYCFIATETMWLYYILCVVVVFGAPCLVEFVKSLIK